MTAPSLPEYLQRDLFEARKPRPGRPHAAHAAVLLEVALEALDLALVDLGNERNEKPTSGLLSRIDDVHQARGLIHRCAGELRGMGGPQ